MFFLMYYLYFHLCPLPFVLSVGTTEKSGSLFSIPSHHVFIIHIVGFPPSLLFSMLNSSSSLSLYSYVIHFKPLIIFMALHWTHSSLSMSLLYWVDQTWSQHSSRGLTRAEQRGMITSLNLLAILFLISSYRFP